MDSITYFVYAILTNCFSFPLFLLSDIGSEVRLITRIKYEIFFCSFFGKIPNLSFWRQAIYKFMIKQNFENWLLINFFFWLKWGHPYITSAYFWPFWTQTHPLYQHKYSTQRQQKGPFFRPTNPVLLMT